MTKSDYAVIALVVLVVVALIAGLMYAVGKDAEKWELFKTANHCVEVAHISGDTFNTVGFDSRGGAVIGIGSAPSKTGWKCDDGITYYR